MSSPNPQRMIACGSATVTFAILLLWGRLALNHFEKIEGHQSLAGLANEARYFFWSIEVPSCAGMLMAVVGLLSIVVLVIRKKANFKEACILAGIDALMLIALFFTIVYFEFEAFN